MAGCPMSLSSCRGSAFDFTGLIALGASVRVVALRGDVTGVVCFWFLRAILAGFDRLELRDSNVVIPPAYFEDELYRGT